MLPHLGAISRHPGPSWPHLGPILDAMYPGQPPRTLLHPLVGAMLPRLGAISRHPGPSWPHLGRYVTPLLGAIRARWAYRGRSGALSRRFRGATLPASSRWVLNPARIRVWGTALGTSETPRKPLPEALPSGLSRARPRSNARVGASETTPGGSPQWPVVRAPTPQRTRERKNAVKRTVFCAPKRKKHCKARGFGSL